MSRYTKITVFLVLSFTLHLLFLFINIPSKPTLQTIQTVGVGLVQRSFSPVNSKPQETDQADTAPVIPPSAGPKESATIPPVLKQQAVVTESVAKPTKQLTQPSLPVDEKPPRAKQIEKVVAPVSEPQLASQSEGQGASIVSTPQKGAAEQGNTTTDVTMQSLGTADIDSRPAPAILGFQDALPRYDLNPRPVYPEVSWRRGQQGTVLLEVAVLADGSVEKVILSQSSGHKILDRAALTAVRRWRFRPAASAGIAVASRVVVPVIFGLQNDN